MAVYEEQNISIEQGELVLVCGPTGGGKTSFLRRIKRSIPDIAGLVMQNTEQALVCERVYEELAFALQNTEDDTAVIKRRIAETAGYFGISKIMDREIATLSGGEKQIVSIASVMAAAPKLLLMDEPLSMLDPAMADKLTALIIKLNRELGITIVVAEHNVDFLFAAADKVILVDSGIQLIETPANAALKMRNGKYGNYLPSCSKYAGDNIALTVADAAKCGLANAKTYSSKTVCGEVLVEVKKITFGYERFKPVLKDISLKLHRGEIVALFGENGSGKTTLANIISGRYKPFSGKVKMEKTIGTAFLFQDATCHFLEDVIDGKHVYDMSGGEKQKHALDIIMQDNSDILILDEPTKALDALEKNNLAQRIREYAKQGKTVLIITHDIDFAAEIAERMMLIHNGEIVADDDTEAFTDDNIFYTTTLKKIERMVQ